MAKNDPAPGPARPAGARTPPHNLQAEESLLGAMLLARDAIAAAAEVVRPEHFYKPAHVHVYDAVLGLYGSGEPVDPITVADELARAGLLDVVGGPSALIGLQANAPAISNAGRYARIIEELALLRRMIGVAGEIAELGYSMPDDVLKAVDAAESMVFDLAQHRQAGTTATIRQLLEQSLDRLEQLYERGEAITGTPTGYLDLDELLAGLQPNALVVVGARPAMGKALALDTPIPTPDGWTTMGALAPGDVVFDDRGRPCTVTYVSPVHLGRDCYRVRFDDGTAIVADSEHLWLARDAVSERPPRVVTTSQMLTGAGEASGPVGQRWYVPAADALDLPDVDLPVDPYVLGAALGGGRPVGRSAGGGEPGGSSTTVGADAATDGPVPARYLRASEKQRLTLLEGLGSGGRAVIDERGTVALRVAGRALAHQARELICSLGQRPGPLHPAPRGVGHSGVAAAWTVRWVPARCPGERAVTAVTAVPSVPVRCITVDSPSHLYLAGESMIPTHNTSFALGMASHAALVGQRPVLFFSLEMSQIEITQRLLCSEARVDASRVRNGRLNEGDWEKISHTVGRLAEAPMWIDDNPNLTVMEIRSKARKLKSQVGDLGMVVVDYIQLMTGRTAAESRQVEVAEISRGLKILAREIETPVVALAQLNRGLEQRADKRPMLSDLRESGCLPAGTRILRADNGDETTLGELVLSEEQPLIWSVDEQHRLVPAPLVRAFPSGVKPVFRLHLASGRTVEASANHPFLTRRGWTRLDELEPGCRIAVPGRLPAPLTAPAPLPADELVLLAHLLGAGAIGAEVVYTTTDTAAADLVAGLAEGLFAIDVERRSSGVGDQVVVPVPREQPGAVVHPLVDWLARHGLWPATPSTMSVPAAVAALADRDLVRFVRDLWHASARRRRGGCRAVGPPHITCAVSSRRLALDLQRLLLRFGVRSTVDCLGWDRGLGDAAAWLVRVDDEASRERLAEVLNGRIPADAAAPTAPTATDVAWDEVIAIASLGAQPTFDATVPGTHSFIADGVVVHNSLEQDADVVLFLYRDEVYNRESPDQGIAEVIVAKHRSGPTGAVRLAFLGQYTKFVNMARS